MEGCKFQVSGSQGRKRTHGQKIGPVQCHLCQHWTHPPCVGEKDEDIISIWTCPSCRTIPVTLQTMMSMMMKIQEDNEQLKTLFTSKLDSMQATLKQKDSHLQKLTEVVSDKTKDNANAVHEITALRTKVSELNSKLCETSWRNFRSQANSKSLLVGSSMIRDINESHLDNTEVICIRGGLIKDVKKVVTEKPAGVSYDRVVLVAGGNDCAPRDLSSDVTPSSIVDDYRSLVRASKSKANRVTVSSVCPRDISAEVNTRIESVNAGLQVMCNEEDATFVDNTPSFHLADGSCNGFHMAKPVHTCVRVSQTE